MLDSPLKLYNGLHGPFTIQTRPLADYQILIKLPALGSKDLWITYFLVDYFIFAILVNFVNIYLRIVLKAYQTDMHEQTITALTPH